MTGLNGTMIEIINIKFQAWIKGLCECNRE
jgi:hypothetical protein